jgi:hypothetical protein
MFIAVDDTYLVILNAARKHGFPDDYIEQIERWDVARLHRF